MTDSREQMIADLRRLADYLEAHPELPVGEWDHSVLQHSAADHNGYDEADVGGRIDAVRKAAEAMGVEMVVLEDDDADTHYTARIEFGRARYQVAAIIETKEGAETS